MRSSYFVIMLTCIYACVQALVNDPQLIASINDADAGWTAGEQAVFKDMKIGDIQGMLGTRLMNMESVAALPSNPEMAKELPAAFDSRKEWKTCVHPIRNQGHCGSCWAFSATEALSDRLCIASDRKVRV